MGLFMQSPTLMRKGDTMKTRLYNLVAKNNQTDKKVYLTGYPMTHEECCIMKAKFSYHPLRRIELEEVRQDCTEFS